MTKNDRDNQELVAMTKKNSNNNQEKPVTMTKNDRDDQESVAMTKKISNNNQEKPVVMIMCTKLLFFPSQSFFPFPRKKGYPQYCFVLLCFLTHIYIYLYFYVLDNLKNFTVDTFCHD